MYTGLHVKFPFFLSDINETSIFVDTYFFKYRNINSHENPSGRRRADRHTDMTKLTVAFRNIANTPNVLPTGCIYVSWGPQSVHFAVRTKSLTTIRVNLCLYMPYHASGSKSPSCYREGPESMPGQFVWDWWWKKWQWDRLFFEHFDFSPVSIIPPVSILILIYMLFLLEGQMTEAW